MTLQHLALLGCLALGLLLALRGVALVVTDSEGRFRFDALVTTLAGFALMLIGVALID